MSEKNPQKLFGTDGIRGKANSHPMTAEVALKVGRSAGRQFLRGDHRHRAVIAKDTRLSGYMLEPALTAGFVSMGMDVVLVGPMPTPALAMLTTSLRADIGVMISASHNPYEDNGIKLFGPDGYKLSDDVEAAIEAGIHEDLVADQATPEGLGRARRLEDAQGRYMEFLKRTFPKGKTLEGLKIVVDCANGAAYRIAPTVLWELGADVVAIGNMPDGFNINRNCGSTHPEVMCAAVKEHGADMGIALDGDADRVLIADENGALLDGDQLIGAVAKNWKDSERLSKPGVVATVMSNLGLEHYLGGLGLSLERTRVGDRYVVEHMRSGGFNVGGEQSGHIILGDYATTGDGTLAALQVLALVVDRGKPASEVCRVFDPLPQVLKNVRLNGAGESPLEIAAVKTAIADGEGALNGQGRLLIRQSGTEPVVRVMAEGEDEALILRVVDDIVSALEQAAR